MTERIGTGTVRWSLDMTCGVLRGSRMASPGPSKTGAKLGTENQPWPRTRMWNSAMQSEGNRKYCASSSGGDDSMAHGAASFAFKKTAPVSRTTLSVSDRTSIGGFPFVCWCDPNKVWCLGQHSESLGHCLRRGFLAYSTTVGTVIVTLRAGGHDAF